MKPFEIIVSILISIALGLSAFTLKWVFDTNAQIAVAREQLTNVLSDSAVDNTQSATLSKHWKLHSWERVRINELRVQQGLPIAAWPDL